MEHVEPERRFRAPLTVRSGARPFQMMVMAGGLLAGVIGILNRDTRSGVIYAAFGEGTLYWYGSLVLWCGLTLVALILQFISVVRRGWSAAAQPRGEERLAVRLRLEQAGLLGFSGTAVSWGAAAFTLAGATAATASVWIGLFGGAAVWRALEIQIDLRKLDRARADPHPAYPIPLGDPRERQ